MSTIWHVTLEGFNRTAEWIPGNKKGVSKFSPKNTMLELTQAMLDPVASSGEHVVEAETETDGKFPLAILSKNQPMVALHLRFQEKVVFDLSQGTGPVHLTGNTVKMSHGGYGYYGPPYGGWGYYGPPFGGYGFNIAWI